MGQKIHAPLVRPSCITSTHAKICNFLHGNLFPHSPKQNSTTNNKKKKPNQLSLSKALLPLRIQTLPAASFPTEDSRIAQPEASAAVWVAMGRDFANSYAKLFCKH